MLVIKRKLNDSIIVGDAEIVVHEIKRDAVRIGIKAPMRVRVLRKELLTAKQENASGK